MTIIDNIIDKARKAQQDYAHNATQERYDMATLAVAWALMEPDRNKLLSTKAVAQTGLGKIEDKIQKNHRKTLGLLHDIKGVKTTGIIEENTQTAITKIARPIGVIGAVTPSTNPLATPVNNIINALKCGNAIILSPSPKGGAICEELLSYIHTELKKISLNPDLVQMLPLPCNKNNTQELMEKVDLLIVTGSQDNVKRAYRSGKPTIGVGAGNVSVIIDETANVQEAAQKIIASKTFDNATSCSSENACIILESVYDDFMKALQDCGAFVIASQHEKKIRHKLRSEGKLNRNILAQNIDIVAKEMDITITPQHHKLIAVESDDVHADNPLCNEKMSLILGIFKVKNFDEAKETALKIFTILGAGHSIGLHTTNEERAYELAYELPTCRVIVNQAHCFATGGAFNNGMKFSLSMGCGSWGGNSIDDNLYYKHFMNITKIIRLIDDRTPDLSDIFHSYWQYSNN